jgi:hypothetical protein
MRLKCISRYRSATRTVEVGQILDLTDAEAAALMADAPGCWADADAPESAPEPAAEPADKAPDEAPADRMVKRSVRK